MAGRTEHARPVSLREVRKGNGEIGRTGQAPQAGESGTPGGAVGSRASQPDQPVSSPSVSGTPDASARRMPDAAQGRTPDGSGSNQPEPRIASAPTPPSPDSPQPPSPAPPGPSTSGEEARHVYVIGNQTAGVMDQARTIASESIRSWYKPGDEETADAQRTRKGKKPGAVRRFFEKAKLHLVEERHRQRLIGEAAAAVRDNKNLQTLCNAPVIRGALEVSNGDHKRDEHQANQVAKAQQVRIQHEHGLDFGAQRIGQGKEIFPLPKDGQVFQELVDIIEPLVSRGEETTPERVEHAVLDVVRRHEQAPEVQAIFGKDGRGRDYRMIATDLLQQAQKQREAHGDAYNSGERDLQEDIDIVVAKLRDGARSSIEKNWVDKAVDFSQNQLRGVVNPMTVATAASAAVFLAQTGPAAIARVAERSKFILTPIVPLYLAVGAAAAGVVAGVRHRKELNDNVELHRRKDANGEEFTGDAKQQEQTQRYTHHDGVTAHDLIQGGTTDTRGEQRVVSTQ